jgi:hypothetical protein
MNHYILNLEAYTTEAAEKIIQNLRFWCVDFIQRGKAAVYQISSIYELTPAFLSSKGIPENCITPA